MRTPEEIKKGLECCILETDDTSPVDHCRACPYKPAGLCFRTLLEDALALIEQLEAEKNALKQAARDVKKHIENAKHAAERIDERLSRLKQSGTDMNVPRWISVEEKLPDDGLDVIVYTDRCGGNVEYAYYRYERDAWFKNCVLLRYNVTHWMPLPEAPKEHQ